MIGLISWRKKVFEEKHYKFFYYPTKLLTSIGGINLDQYLQTQGYLSKHLFYEQTWPHYDNYAA